MWEMQILMNGEWTSIRPSRDSRHIAEFRLPPYRYECIEDATMMLRRLYPDVPIDQTRVEWAKNESEENCCG